jgi:hypothetical protein
MQHEPSTGISTEMQQCIDECTQCHNVCLSTLNHCLERGGKHADPAHIGLLLDCADTCRISADFMLRGSDRHQLACRICADICGACAESCEHIGSSDETMLQCAQECRRCQQSCERMAA